MKGLFHMKKTWVVLPLIILLSLFTSCTRGKNDIGDENENIIKQNEECTSPNDYNDDITNTDSIVIPLVTHANQRFINDLEYFINVIENNFSLLNLAHRVRDIDIYAIAEDVRNILLASEEMTAEMFGDLLAAEFGALSGRSGAHQHVGHFAIFGRCFASSDMIYDRWIKERQKNSFSNAEDLIEFYSIIFGYEKRDQLRNAVDNNDVESFWDLTSSAHAAMEGMPNVTTKILEENRIAYMEIHNFIVYEFIRQRLADEQHIFDFYEEIKDFEHLIIDLRRNRGGHTEYFYQLIMAPNIKEPVSMNGYVFSVQDGGFSFSNMDLGFLYYTVGANVDRRIRPFNEIIDEFYLPQLNMYDMERIQYGFRIRYTLNPRPLERFDYQPAFNGKIWLLVGPGVGSAAHIASWLARDTGFATLVGKNTGGNFGGSRPMFTLPNSRIEFTFDTQYYTDQYGYGIEAGIVPHYYSRPGMGALETVLAMIEEGGY
jgi:hypothetical protein